MLCINPWNNANKTLPCEKLITFDSLLGKLADSNEIRTKWQFCFKKII